MNTFLILLATFYICDALAEEGPLDHSTHLRCAAAFETLKISLLTDKEREALVEIGFARSAQAHHAMLRFGEWEHDHAGLVARFKDEARTVVLSMGLADTPRR
jgi:hypothetical protein